MSGFNNFRDNWGSQFLKSVTILIRNFLIVTIAIQYRKPIDQPNATHNMIIAQPSPIDSEDVRNAMVISPQKTNAPMITPRVRNRNAM